jgi:hypothetical protein
VRELFGLLDGEKWVRADEKKIKAAADEDDQSGLEQVPVAPTAAAPDVTGATALVGAVTSAEQSGTTVTGTLDATEVDPAAGDPRRAQPRHRLSTCAGVHSSA